MRGSALFPIEQRAVVFNEDEITAVLVEGDDHQVVYATFTAD